MSLRAPILASLVACALAAWPLTGFAQEGDAEATPYEQSPASSVVSVEGTAGAETLTIVARKAELEAVLNQIAAASGRQVIGFDLLSRHPKIDANLKGENLRDALGWIGGSVSMRIKMTASDLTVTEDLSPYPTRQDLHFRAFSGYSVALRDHASSKHAPEGAWKRARIEADTPGREKEAAEAFDWIAETYPKSALVPGALLEAGTLWGKHGNWDEAAARFDALARHPREHGYSVTSRRLLADAYTRVAEEAENAAVAKDNARRAILVLNALDDDDPTRDLYERRRRSLVRSRAESLSGNPVGALKALDIAEKYSDRGPNDPEIAELRALAFERAERHEDASKAWMRHATLVEGEQRAASYGHAAAAANASRDNLAAIAIWKAADNEGLGDFARPHADAAYIALELIAPQPDIFRDEERLARGEKLVKQEMFDEAIDALRPLFDRRSALERAQHRRLTFAYARALAEMKRVDEALLVLRKCAGEMDRGADRRDVYLFAARILEEAEELDRAIAALEGRL